MDPVIVEQLGRAHPLAAHLDDFLTDLANAGASPHTRRAYRGGLLQFAAYHHGEIPALSATPIRAYLAESAELSAASRKRKRAAIASFSKWAVRHDLLQANPLDRIGTVKVPKTLPRPAKAADVAKGASPRGSGLRRSARSARRSTARTAQVRFPPCASTAVRGSCGGARSSGGAGRLPGVRRGRRIRR
ncbi:site-specific integrase [Nonomuraea mangrovi]|uniref:Site-specific integrase n=1 Tax=Nonomuraea mangrovi TaxID=2316207 RepID=A0ABW4TER7_9ACTN